MDNKFTSPMLLVSFLGTGAAPDGEPIGCTVVEVIPGTSWDVVPHQNSQIGPFSRVQWAVSRYAGAGVPIGATFDVRTSPVVYPAPAVGPAVRLTAVDGTGTPVVLPPDTVVNVRAYRAAA